MRSWLIAIILFVSPYSFALKPLKKPLDKPKLLVVLVVDQLRGDYFSRFDKRFLPAQSKNTLGGFKYLTSKGAYFPAAEYEVLQAMTCPGHAMIMTGAPPVMNGIILNEWYDKVARKMVYCADDAKNDISPFNLKTSAVPDELKLAGHKSKVVGIALKDRSAIMLTGHNGDHVYWIDSKKGQWTTSKYYSADGNLPDWVKSQNEKISKLNGTDYVWESKEKPTGLSDDNTVPFIRKIKYGEKAAFTYPFGVQISFDLAQEAIKNLKLGQGNSTDVLAVSLSSHDALGHRFGPNSREMEEMTVFEDRAVSKFLNFLQSQKLLKDSVIVFTADHGVAPSAPSAQNVRLDAGKIDYLNLFKRLNSHLDKRFGKPKNNQWIAAFSALNFYFDRETLAERKVDLVDAETEAKKIMIEEPGVWHVLTSSEIRKGHFPTGVFGTQIQNQYNIEHSGDLLIIPRPFFMDGGESTTTHVTGFAYDRTVPLVILGNGVQPGTYPHQAKILDIAPTVSFMLGLLPPATSQGKILEIFQ